MTHHVLEVVEVCITEPEDYDPVSGKIVTFMQWAIAHNITSRGFGINQQNHMVAYYDAKHAPRIRQWFKDNGA